MVGQLGPSSAYTSTDSRTMQTGYHGGYVDPNELRAATVRKGHSETDSFYDAYIIRQSFFERSTIDNRGCHGNHIN